MTLRQTLGLFALCLLVSTTWLTGTLLPPALSPVVGYGFRLLLVGMAGLLVYLPRRRRDTPPSVARCAVVGLVSFGLIGIPFLLLASAEGKVPATYGVLVFAGMPILLAVIVASFTDNSSLRPLPYGLLGVAGILILLPISLPQVSVGILGAGAICLAMVFTALSLFWLHRLLNEFPVLLAIGLAGLINGGLLLLTESATGIPHWNLRGIGVEIQRCILLDLPEILLLMWLTKTVTPQRLSSQYLIAPLLTVIEGWVVFRPGLDGRTILGVTLLGASAYLLIRSEDAAPEITLKLQERSD